MHFEKGEKGILKRELMPRRAKEKEVINSLCFLMGAFKDFSTWLNQILQAVPASGILFYISLLLSPNNIYRNSIMWHYISGEIEFLSFVLFWFFPPTSICSAWMDNVLSEFGSGHVPSQGDCFQY